MQNLTKEEEKELENMDYSKLSDPGGVLSWFQYQGRDLCDLGATWIEERYLEAIDEVARRTGASNFWLADYIWRLEKRIERIEQRQDSQDRCADRQENNQ
jgi:hypothetical protein